MDRVSAQRETFVITKHGRPVARLVPVEPASSEPLFGRLRHVVVDETGSLTEPVLPATAWEAGRPRDAVRPPGAGTRGARRGRRNHRPRS